MLSTAKGRAIVCAALIIGAGTALWSCERIKTIEEKTLLIAHPEASEPDTSGTAYSDISLYELGNAINMAGFQTYERVMQDGVTFKFENPRFLSPSELEDDTGYFDSFFGTHDVDYILVDLEIANESDEPTPSLWFSLDSGSLAIPCDERATEALNGFSVDENYNATNEFYYRAEPHSTQRILLAYMLEKNAMSEKQWDSLTTLDFSLTFLDYPKKIIVPLGNPKDWS